MYAGNLYIYTGVLYKKLKHKYLEWAIISTIPLTLQLIPASIPTNLN